MSRGNEVGFLSAFCGRLSLEWGRERGRGGWRGPKAALPPLLPPKKLRPSRGPTPVHRTQPKLDCLAHVTPTDAAAPERTGAAKKKEKPRHFVQKPSARGRRPLRARPKRERELKKPLLPAPLEHSETTIRNPSRTNAPKPSPRATKKKTPKGARARRRRPGGRRRRRKARECCASRARACWSCPPLSARGCRSRTR